MGGIMGRYPSYFGAPKVALGVSAAICGFRVLRIGGTTHTTPRATTGGRARPARVGPYEPDRYYWLVWRDH